MITKKRTLAIVSGGIMVVACALYITSNALPSWSAKYIATGRGSIKATVGLWKSCRSVSAETVCVDYPISCSSTTSKTSAICSKMMAARAFMTIACVVSGISAVCLFLCALEITNHHQRMILISKVLTIASFVMGIIGVVVGIIFAIYIDGSPIKPSISVAAILAIIGVVVNIIAAILAIIIRGTLKTLV